MELAKHVKIGESLFRVSSGTDKISSIAEYKIVFISSVKIETDTSSNLKDTENYVSTDSMAFDGYGNKYYIRHSDAVKEVIRNIQRLSQKIINSLSDQYDKLIIYEKNLTEAMEKIRQLKPSEPDLPF